MTHPQIIGLNGVARAGKDTVGNILHDLYGYEIVSFSDALNNALIALNPWLDTGSLSGGGGHSTYERYASAVKRLGYEQAKDTYPEVRRLLQCMGTEVGRNMFGQDIWVEAMFKNYSGQKWAVVNARFPNEFEAIWSREGVIWEVTRPGFKPALGHVSDTAGDHLQKDAYIDNDGTIEELAQQVITLMDEGEDVKADLQASFNNGFRESRS